MGLKLVAQPCRLRRRVNGRDKAARRLIVSEHLPAEHTGCAGPPPRRFRSAGGIGERSIRGEAQGLPLVKRSDSLPVFCVPERRIQSSERSSISRVCGVRSAPRLKGSGRAREQTRPLYQQHRCDRPHVERSQAGERGRERGVSATPLHLGEQRKRGRVFSGRERTAQRGGHGIIGAGGDMKLGSFYFCFGGVGQHRS